MRKLDAIVGEITSLDPLKFGGGKGRNMIFDGNNIDMLTKRVDGNHVRFSKVIGITP